MSVLAAEITRQKNSVSFSFPLVSHTANFVAERSGVAY